MLSWRKTISGIAIAASLCAQAAGQGLLRDSEIEAFLYEMSEPLWEVAELPEGSVEILLVGDPTPNAFAGAQGGLKMGIHTGLITLADTPSQIEGVIAHETGHLAGGHSVRTAEALARAGRPQIMGLLLGVALIAAGAPPEAGIGAIGLGQSFALDSYLTYSRGQESAADQAALTYLDGIGRSSEGLLEFFSKLQNQQLIRSRQPVPYLQTHPLALQRVTRLRERAELSPYWGQTDTAEEIYELRMIQAKIHGFLNDPHTVLRQYPLSDQTDPARYARAVAYYRSSDLEGAEREIGRLLTAYPDNPYFHELHGQMLFEHGRVEESVGPHRRASELAPEFALLKINLARALVTTDRDENVEEAIEVLEAAIRQERNSAYAWSILARAQSHRGREDLALLAQAETAFHAGDTLGANRFATRARGKLTAGTPEYQQAVDIIVATAEAAGRPRQVRRR